MKLASKNSRTIGESLEETKDFHRRYLRAVNNPLRRKILKTLKEMDTTTESLSTRMGLETGQLEWHLSILEHGFCVEKEVRDGRTFYKLTQEGRVVDYVEP